MDANISTIFISRSVSVGFNTTLHVDRGPLMLGYVNQTCKQLESDH